MEKKTKETVIICWDLLHRVTVTVIRIPNRMTASLFKWQQAF